MTGRIRRFMNLMRREPDADDRPPVPDEAFAGEHAAERRIMIEQHLWRRGVTDPVVLVAMARTPRHAFIDHDMNHLAYADHPLDIGHGQTISQPYVVARTIELAQVRPGRRVLEIGVGCGYQAAVMAAIGAQVFGIEIVRELAESAAERLARLGYDNVCVRHGDGFEGWPEHAPFDAIVLAAAPRAIPPPLLDQLAAGGRLVGPVGTGDAQMLVRVTRRADGLHEERVMAVRYVPMTGRAQRGGS